MFGQVIEDEKCKSCVHCVWFGDYALHYCDTKDCENYSKYAIDKEQFDIIEFQNTEE